MPQRTADDHDTAIDARGIRYRYPSARGRRGRRGARREGDQRPPGGSRSLAVDGVDLRVAAGETVALLGPNGSGKSTLMAILAGLRAADEGTVRIGGGERAGRLGVVFQSVALDPFVTVLENLRDAGRLTGLASAEAVRRARERLGEAGLGDLADRRAGRLSGGQQRRVDLVRALLHDPDVLLLDEPTTGLDPAARQRFLETLAEERVRRRPAMLLSTHLVDEAEPADRVVLMDAGRVVADGPPAQLRAGLGARRLTVTDAAFDAAAWPGDWQRGAAGWWRPLAATGAADGGGDDDDGSLVARLVDAGLPVHVAPPTLADAFEVRTGRVLTGPAADAAAGTAATTATRAGGAEGGPDAGLAPATASAPPPAPAPAEAGP